MDILLSRSVQHYNDFWWILPQCDKCLMIQMLFLVLTNVLHDIICLISDISRQVHLGNYLFRALFNQFRVRCRLGILKSRRYWLDFLKYTYSLDEFHLTTVERGLRASPRDVRFRRTSLSRLKPPWMSHKEGLTQTRRTRPTLARSHEGAFSTQEAREDAPSPNMMERLAWKWGDAGRVPSATPGSPP